MKTTNEKVKDTVTIPDFPEIIDPWQYGVIAGGHFITPVALKEIYRTIKIYEGYRAYTTWILEGNKTVGDVFETNDTTPLPERLSDDALIKIYEDYHEAIEDETGEVEQSICKRVFKETLEDKKKSV